MNQILLGNENYYTYGPYTYVQLAAQLAPGLETTSFAGVTQNQGHAPP